MVRRVKLQETTKRLLEKNESCCWDSSSLDINILCLFKPTGWSSASFPVGIGTARVAVQLGSIEEVRQAGVPVIHFYRANFTALKSIGSNVESIKV